MLESYERVMGIRPFFSREAVMNILQLPMDEVHPYGNNPRKNDNAVDAVAASIKKYGFLVPMVISKEH